MKNFDRFSVIEAENPEIKRERQIKAIEDCSLDCADKHDLILLALDRKKAALFSNAELAETKEEKAIKTKNLSKELEGIKKVLEEAGFLSSASEIKVKDNFVYYRIIIGNDEKSLAEFAELEKRKDYKEEGILLGFPKTAVEAYGTDKELSDGLPEKEKNELAKDGVTKFLNFSPSKDHWREELEEVKVNQCLIKEKSPRLYKEIINSEELF